MALRINNAASGMTLAGKMRATPWPALGAGGLAFAATRLGFPTTKSGAASSGNRFQLSNLYFGAPGWATSGWRFYFPNYYVLGGANTERSDTSPIIIDFATVTDTAAGTNAWPITFDGAQSVTIQPGTGVWSDPVAGFTRAANSQAYVRTEIQVQVGQQYPQGYLNSLPGSDLGEGRESLSASATSRRLTGAIVASASTSVAYGPASAVAHGWDGSPVFLTAGTSRMFGQNEYDYKLAARGCTTAVMRGLDSTAGGRMAFGNFSSEGATAQYAVQDWSNGWQLRMAALRALPNVPFNRIITDIGVNDINGAAALTVAQMQRLLDDWWLFFEIRFPGMPIFHTFGEPWANVANSNTKWSTTADQVPAATAVYPGGVQFQIDAWLRTLVRANVTTLDHSSAYQDATYPDRWKVPGTVMTLNTATAANTLAVSATLTSGAPPAEGDCLVLDRGLATAESVIASKVVAAAPTYTITTVSSMATAHAAGNAIGGAYTHEGVHQGSTLAQAAQALIQASKLAGVIA